MLNSVPRKAVWAGMLAAILWVTVLGLNRAVATTTPNVTYTATGQFASPAASGTDSLKLAGETFSISIIASPDSVPAQKGSNWAFFIPLQMTGTVHSGLFQKTPVSIASAHAGILQAIGATSDSLQMSFPLEIFKINVMVHAQMSMPVGTLTKLYIHPFPKVALSPENAVVAYTNGGETTTLTIESGALVATIPSAGDAAQATPAGLGEAGNEVSALVPRFRRFALRNP